MIVYRCCHQKWARDLSGTGSYLHGGRWNTPGTRMVYTAENNVLAAFEIALRIPLDQITKHYVMVPLEIPGEPEAHHPKLPAGWNTDTKTTRALGDSFISEGKFLLMKVPSALISDAFNFLVNPGHDAAKKIVVQEPRPILFDKRLMEMIRLKK